MWILVPFLIALVTVWHHMSRGRTGRGLLLLVLAFGLLDAYLVRGWIQERRDLWTRILEWGLWITAVGEAALLLRRRLLLARRKGRRALRGLFLQGGKLYAQGDGDGTVRIFRKAARLDPWSPSPQVWLGYALLLLGRRFGARRAFRRAAARDRNGEWAHAIRRGLLRAGARPGGKDRVSAGTGGRREGNPGRGKRRVPA